MAYLYHSLCIYIYEGYVYIYITIGAIDKDQQPPSFCVGMSQMETRPVIRRVTLFVADETESTQYCKAQQESEWQDVKFIVSAPGIKDSLG